MYTGNVHARFSQKHAFEKPNDMRALSLMNATGARVMQAYPDMVLGYGESDEYSFVLKPKCDMYMRRSR